MHDNCCVVSLILLTIYFSKTINGLSILSILLYNVVQAFFLFSCRIESIMIICLSHECFPHINTVSSDVQFRCWWLYVCLQTCYANCSRHCTTRKSFPKMLSSSGSRAAILRSREERESPVYRLHDSLTGYGHPLPKLTRKAERLLMAGRMMDDPKRPLLCSAHLCGSHLRVQKFALLNLLNASKLLTDCPLRWFSWCLYIIAYDRFARVFLMNSHPCYGQPGPAAWWRHYRSYLPYLLSSEFNAIAVGWLAVCMVGMEDLRFCVDKYRMQPTKYVIFLQSVIYTRQTKQKFDSWDKTCVRRDLIIYLSGVPFGRIDYGWDFRDQISPKSTSIQMHFTHCNLKPANCMALPGLLYSCFTLASIYLRLSTPSKEFSAGLIPPSMWSSNHLCMNFYLFSIVKSALWCIYAVKNKKLANI